MSKLIKAKKINKYTEGECDAAIIRLENSGQDQSHYYREVVERRQKLLDAASERARIIREQAKSKKA